MNRAIAPLAALLLAAALWLAACSGVPSSTTESAATSIFTAMASTTPKPLTPTFTASPPTATFTPTATLPPTPEPIDISRADRFQPLRVNYLDDGQLSLFARALTSDGRLLALSGSLLDPGTGHQTFDTFLHLVEVDGARTAADLELLAPVVQTMAFSPDGRTLAVAACQAIVPWSGPPLPCDPSTTRLWTVNLASGAVAHDLGRFTSPVVRIVWSPDSSRLYTGVLFSRRSSYGDNEVAIFDAATGQRLGIVQPEVRSGFSLLPGVSADGRFVAVHLAGEEPAASSVEWWDAPDPTRPRRIYLERPANGFLLSPNGTDILTVTAVGSIMRLIDLETGQVRHTISGLRQLGSIKDLAFAGPQRLVWLQPDGEIQLYDLAAQAFVPVPESLPRSARSLRVAPDGKTVLVVPSDPAHAGEPLQVMGVLWDVETGQVADIPGHVLHSSFWASYSFSPNQTRLVSPDLAVLQVAVWGIRIPEQERALTALRDYLDALAASEYERAANLLELADEEDVWRLGAYDLATILASVPEADPADPAGLLEILCTDERFPWAPVLEVVYQAQLDADSYLFLITFAGEDGRRAVWPPCQNLPASNWCLHRDGTFAYAIRRQPDGSFRVVNGMPPALDLRQPG